MKLTYKKIPFQIYVRDAIQNQESCLFEQSLSWLVATHEHLLAENADVYVHCVFNDDALLLAWPLVHYSQLFGLPFTITSLTSFYSTVSQPLAMQNLIAYSRKSDVYRFLLTEVQKNNHWNCMQLGPFNEMGELVSELAPSFKWCKVFSIATNWYQNDIENYSQYYQQLPSQLKNTIARKQKKLSAQHVMEIKFVRSETEFDQYFDDYKYIYQLSWKGEEGCFSFIKHVCLAALSMNKLRMALLFVDGEPAAAQIWFVDNQIASIFKLAYTPNFAIFSVGSILSLAISEHVIDVDKVHTIEFGMGNEQYKKSWLKKSRARVSYQVFNHQTLSGALSAFRYLFLSKLSGCFTKKRD